MTTNIFIVQITNMQDDRFYKLLGVYTSKELADAAGLEACEMWDEGRMHHTVTMLPLDDMINGVHKSEL
jgi:hypothetical protein